MAKSAIEKIQENKHIKIVKDMPEGISWAPPGSSMVVSTPKEVDSLMAMVPEGKLLSLTRLREALAAKHGTSIACPMSTAIFTNISAKAAEDRRALGESELTPWWRCLKTDGLLNPKFPGGPDEQIHLLRLEGHTVVPKGKKNWRVENYEMAEFDLLTALGV